MTLPPPQPGFTLVPDLIKQQPIPKEGILTRLLFEDDAVRAVLFTFSRSQKLTEHTASAPALLYFLSGEATITLGAESFDVRPGAWVRMDAHLSHSVITRTAVVMLLVLVKHPDKT
jgi:quercetin dioxygenase-like cupin family protein